MLKSQSPHSRRPGNLRHKRPRHRKPVCSRPYKGVVGRACQSECARGAAVAAVTVLLATSSPKEVRARPHGATMPSPRSIAGLAVQALGVPAHG